MADAVKTPESKTPELKTPESKTKKPETFNIPINTPEGKVYNFSGPINPTTLELKQVSLRLFEEFTVRGWRETMIKQENERLEKEKVSKKEEKVESVDARISDAEIVQPS